MRVTQVWRTSDRAEMRGRDRRGARWKGDEDQLGARGDDERGQGRLRTKGHECGRCRWAQVSPCGCEACEARGGDEDTLPGHFRRAAAGGGGLVWTCGALEEGAGQGRVLLKLARGEREEGQEAAWEVATLGCRPPAQPRPSSLEHRVISSYIEGSLCSLAMTSTAACDALLPTPPPSPPASRGTAQRQTRASTPGSRARTP